MRRLLALLPLLVAADWPAEPSDAPWSSTAQGVEVQDVVVGSGTVVVDRSGVEVHYTGMLADGSVFDTSRERDQTLSFRVGGEQVIEGWEEGLVGMALGGTRRLVIPPQLAYGDRVAGEIPPNSTLYFEVELMGVLAPRLAPTSPSAVDDLAWQDVGKGRVADLVVGTGKPVRDKDGARVCLDYTSFDEADAVVEHTWGRDACTWYRLRDNDLPAVLEAGLPKMRAGGTRLIGAQGQLFEVVVEAVGR